MPGVYKLTEVIGTSPVSFAEATKVAIAEVSKTIRQVDWFEVVEMRGHVKNGQVDEFQVTLKVGFKIER
jgi:dodecin